ncbi:tryptophan-rich sensory protein [Patescibacteria group bacterium]|nr:tryptophan-rich sensory protein [Patescibacteria group bacterium]
MKIKINYFIIPLITVLVSLSGSLLTNSGMDWYDTLNLPAVTPLGSFIGLVWTVIFILTAISALLVWNKAARDNRFKLIIILFIANALLNIFWSFLFFYQHLILAAVIEMIILEITVLILIYLIWKINKTASWLLAPYAVWVIFATYLAVQILLLN